MASIAQLLLTGASLSFVPERSKFRSQVRRIRSSPRDRREDLVVGAGEQRFACFVVGRVAIPHNATVIPAPSQSTPHSPTPRVSSRLLRMLRQMICIVAPQKAGIGFRAGRASEHPVIEGGRRGLCRRLPAPGRLTARRYRRWLRVRQQGPPASWPASGIAGASKVSSLKRGNGAARNCAGSLP